MCKRGAGSLPLDWSEYREHQTEFIKASTKPNSIAKNINKVYKNLMIDLKISNDKLQNRAVNIISKLTLKNIGKSEKLLSQSKGNLKSAILMHKLKVTYSESLKLINV